MTITSAHSTRNTSIRTRKIRGEDSFTGSISIAERKEEPEGIADVIRCEKPLFGPNMAQRAREKRPLAINRRWQRELPRETGSGRLAYFYKALTPQAVNGNFL